MRLALAQAHEESGDLHAAVEQYRRVIRTSRRTSRLDASDGGNAAKEAARRLAALGPTPEAVRAGSESLTALQISPGHLPPRTEIPQWLRSLRQTGMTTLVLEMGSRSSGASPQGRGQPPAPAGVYFRTNRATVIDDAIDRLIPLAHQHGLAVHVVVTLRQMDWLKPALGWADRPELGPWKKSMNPGLCAPRTM